MGSIYTCGLILVDTLFSPGSLQRDFGNSVHIHGTGIPNTVRLTRHVTYLAGTCTGVIFLETPIFVNGQGASTNSIGGSRGRAGCTPPYGTKFFHFRIHFCQKVPTLEVQAPPNGSTTPPNRSMPPKGNPGSTTEQAHYSHTVVDPGFPIGGVGPLGGHQPLMRVLFGKNVCKNERIRSHRGPYTRHAPML